MKAIESPQPVVLGEDFDRAFDAFDDLDGTGDMGLRFPDGRYHIFDDELDAVVEIHADGRRFRMLWDGEAVVRGPEIL